MFYHSFFLLYEDKKASSTVEFLERMVGRNLGYIEHLTTICSSLSWQRDLSVITLSFLENNFNEDLKKSFIPEDLYVLQRKHISNREKCERIIQRKEEQVKILKDENVKILKFIEEKKQKGED